MRNIRLVIAYDGTDFCGWQRQPKASTVQACLEKAIAGLVGHRVKAYGSGRTDAGVHALNQVANFRTSSPIPCANLAKALNDALPPTVRVKEAQDVSDKFHARYDARSKTYRYRILQAPLCSPFIWRFVYHHPYPLDRGLMAEAARLLEGEHDFASFAAAKQLEVGEGLHGPPARQEHDEGDLAPPARELARHRVRRIFLSRILWRPRTAMLIYEVRANGFLYHMVRNIVGTLMEVGRGKLAPQEIVRILEARDRTLAGPTAPARGLCLMKVEY
jgi:tRNA pseudouridine38-40 synthase